MSRTQWKVVLTQCSLFGRTSQTATGVAGAATKYVVAANSYTPVAGTAVTLTAQLADQYNNAVATSSNAGRALAHAGIRVPKSHAVKGVVKAEVTRSAGVTG